MSMITVLVTISGYEVLVVALATVALAIMVCSALAGVVVRFRRGPVDGESERRHSPFGRRR